MHSIKSPSNKSKIKHKNDLTAKTHSCNKQTPTDLRNNKALKTPALHFQTRNPKLI